ncbi:hypothetical protein BS47DRAFT_1337819, partial [Hydnum rufescens UP504]
MRNQGEQGRKGYMRLAVAGIIAMVSFCALLFGDSVFIPPSFLLFGCHNKSQSNSVCISVPETPGTPRGSDVCRI